MIGFEEIVEKLKRYRVAVGVIGEENPIFVEIRKVYSFDNGFWEIRASVFCCMYSEEVRVYRGIEKKVDEMFDEIVEKYGLVENVDITDVIASSE